MKKILYKSRIKSICRQKGYSISRGYGHFSAETEITTYDIIIIGSVRRVGKFELIDENHYIMQRVNPIISEHMPDYFLKNDFEENKIKAFLLTGKIKSKALPDTSENTKSILLFLSKLVSWKNTDSESPITNGSKLFGRTFYDAENFILKLE